MISISHLTASLDGDWVVFDKHGSVLDREVPSGVGPAALLTSEPVDALKRVDDQGTVVAAVERSSVWTVDALVLNSVILQHLDGEMTVDELLDAVRAAGFSWQISPSSAP